MRYWRTALAVVGIAVLWLVVIALNVAYIDWLR